MNCFGAQGAMFDFTPVSPGTTEQPAVIARQPNGSEFLSGACTSTAFQAGQTEQCIDQTT